MSPTLESLKRAVEWGLANGKGSVITKLAELSEVLSAAERCEEAEPLIQFVIDNRDDGAFEDWERFHQIFGKMQAWLDARNATRR